MSKKQIKVMDTSFRDGFQSIYGAKVLVDDFIPALQAAAASGIKHFETGSDPLPAHSGPGRFSWTLPADVLPTDLPLPPESAAANDGRHLFPCIGMQNA